MIFILPQIELKHEDYFKSRKINQYVPEGVVTNKYVDTTFGARNAKLIFVDQRGHELFNYEIFQEIKIGDKVRKDKGSVYFYINDIQYIYVSR